MDRPVVIVGAGLSGLRSASLLTSRGVRCLVLEARNRIGGRAFSEQIADRPELGWFDLGPTWFWPDFQPTISRLVDEFGLSTITRCTEGAMLVERSSHTSAQRLRLPANSLPTSIRLVGGIRSLIDAVAKTLPSGTIKLGARVTGIAKNAGQILVRWTDQHGYGHEDEARTAILALPPRVVARRIEFSPTPRPEVMQRLVSTTWLAGQAKAVAVYDRPFWREQGLSGFASSIIGPLGEVHDASPHEKSGALFGFFGTSALARRKLGETKVRELVVSQLTRLFGPDASQPTAIFYKDWSTDPETAVDEDLDPLGYNPNYRRPGGFGDWNGAIVFAGTEAAPDQGGYLEGALLSAELAVEESTAGVKYR